MQKPAKVQDKHFLKTVHQEIDLFDRKLAHLNRFEVFASDADRDTAARKMNSKRELLVRTARKLAGEGIEFKDSDLPRSFRGVVAVPALVELAEMDPRRSSPSLWA
jgi:hypothetical protein